MKNHMLRPKKRDLILIGVLLAAGVLLLVLTRAPRSTLVARIETDGGVYREVRLSDVREPEDLTLPGGVVVRLYPDGAEILSSPCRGQDCVHTGKLTKAGQCAVCLPKKTALVLLGDDDGAGIDAKIG